MRHRQQVRGSCGGALMETAREVQGAVEVGGERDVECEDRSDLLSKRAEPSRSRTPAHHSPARRHLPLCPGDGVERRTTVAKKAPARTFTSGPGGTDRPALRSQADCSEPPRPRPLYIQRKRRLVALRSRDRTKRGTPLPWLEEARTQPVVSSETGRGPRSLEPHRGTDKSCQAGRSRLTSSEPQEDAVSADIH